MSQAMDGTEQQPQLEQQPQPEQAPRQPVPESVGVTVEALQSDHVLEAQSAAIRVNCHNIDDDASHTVPMSLQTTQTTTDHRRDDDTDCALSLEEVLVNEIANDPEARVECNQNIPQPYIQPHVEAAFQGQTTRKRVTVLLGGGVIKSAGALVFAALGFSEPTTSADWSVPPLFWLVACILWSLCLACLVFCRNSLRRNHSVTQLLTVVMTVVFVSQEVFLNAMYCIFTRADRNEDYEMHRVTFYHISGMTFAGLNFVLAYIAVPLWMFSLTLVYAMSTCAVAYYQFDTLGATAATMTGMTSLVGGTIMFPMARLILLQARYSSPLRAIYYTFTRHILQERQIFSGKVNECRARHTANKLAVETAELAVSEAKATVLEAEQDALFHRLATETTRSELALEKARVLEAQGNLEQQQHEAQQKAFSAVNHCEQTKKTLSLRTNILAHSGAKNVMDSTTFWMVRLIPVK